MLRSLYAGISGMKANQLKLDVNGSNIANASTTGYKCQSLSFSDSLYQTMNDASAPSTVSGGINPKQVGLGVTTSGIKTMMNQGNMQASNSLYDFMVDGDGYFMVARGGATFKDSDSISVSNPAAVDSTSHTISKNPKNLEVSYTRDGSFTTDKEGNLVTAEGYRVLGYSVTDAANASVQSIGDNGTINYVNANAVDANGSSTLKVAGGTDTSYLKSLRIPAYVLTKKGDAAATPPTTDTFEKVTSFSVSKTGLIEGKLEGGNTAVIGQMAIASFKNPQGLTKQGGNRLTESADSGEASIKTGVGEVNDNSKGYGDIDQNYLEMSNVDLAEQFTDMIVATRAFEANSKMISTGDEILQNIVNLKR